MVSSKYSSRRHVPQRPPICNPPLKQVQIIPPPPWPPTATRAKGSITYSGQTHNLDATITPTYPTPNQQQYYATQNTITIIYTITTDAATLHLTLFGTIINGNQIAFGAETRNLNTATPINETYPPWTQIFGPPATGQLTITTA